MDLICDSSSIINLINGVALEKVLKIPSINFFIGQLVYEECEELESQRKLIDKYIADEDLHRFPEDVDLPQFMALKSKYQLGDGETESIAFGITKNFSISSDDAKARSSALYEVGQSKVIGSLFLLREAFRNKLMSCEEAKASFLLMKLKGGFLPNIDENYFCQ